MIIKLKNKKVLVAISGGVDSSVAAALLKKNGYDVAGVFMHFWSEPDGSPTRKDAKFTPLDNPISNVAGAKVRKIESKFCSVEAERIACRVAEKLSIPFYVFHFEKEFKKEVVDYFLKEYREGRTPNPCVVCNREIKFGLLFKKMLELGFDYLATGHYVRIKYDYLKKSTGVEKFKLLKAKDKTKDQSYFLWSLWQKQLSRLLFPVGDYTKKEVYEMAKKWKVAYRKSESFDICFIAGKDHNEFLKKRLKMKPGPIIDTKDKSVGWHEGLPLYTKGQRKDIKIGGTGPYYVIDKDFKTNTLIVTNKQFDNRLYKKSLVAKRVNWVLGKEPKLPLKCQARIRYGHKAVPSIVKSLPRTETKFLVRGLKSKIKSQLFVEFNKSQRAVTPGQSVVFYHRNELLGGGIIL